MELIIVVLAFFAAYLSFTRDVHPESFTARLFKENAKGVKIGLGIAFVAVGLFQFLEHVF